METSPPYKTFLSALIAILISFTLIGSAGAANLAQAQPPQSTPPQIEVISPYYSIEHLTTSDGTQITGSIISGPPHPLPEFQVERTASMTTIAPEGSLANFPSYSWVFGCSAVSGAMIAAWYDRGSYPNMYTGPTNGGVMPLTDSSWSTWSDGSDTDPNTYPNNPLVASHKGVDGRSTPGSIEDYWVSYGNSDPDPYTTGGWTQHSWGDAIGDYMKTSQSAYRNTDGSTHFYYDDSSPDKFTCTVMETYEVDHLDGTYGRKLFYEARGYTVTDCYNQKTDNNSGGFTLANYKAEIDAGNPVLLNLEGHSIVGYGYNGSTIYIRDTWDNNPSHTYTMPWGGLYDDMKLLSVSVVHLKPAPGTTHKLFLPMISDGAPTPVVNPFLNPGFEKGATSWYQNSSGGWDLILHSDDSLVLAHGGSWLAWLGGDDDEVSLLSQTITISASAPYLHFWYWAASQDSCGHDFFRVAVNNKNVFTTDLCEDKNTSAWVQKVLNLSAYAGLSKTVKFSVTTNDSLNSNLFLDDVSMSASASTANIESVATERYPGAASMRK